MDNGEGLKTDINPNDIETPRLRTVEAGEYKPEDIIFIKATDKRPTSEELEEKIDDVWAQETAANTKLFNAPKFDIREIRQTPEGKLEITYGLTDYKTFVGTRPDEVERTYEKSVPCVLSVAVVIETSDGHLVMHQRNQNVFHYKGWVAGVGGNVEAPHKGNPGHTNENGDPDPVKALYEEIEEEAGITRNHISDVICNGFVKNGKRGFGVLTFRAKTDLTKDELEALEGPQDEGQTIITGSDLKEFHKLLGYNQVILHDVLPTLLYIGRERFGEEWYNNAVRRLKISHENYNNLKPHKQTERSAILTENATKKLIPKT